MSDTVGPVVARVFMGVIAAAVGAVAVLGLFLGFSRAGTPETPLRIAGSLLVLAFAVSGFYAALLVWFGSLIGVSNPLRSRAALSVGMLLIALAAITYLAWLLG